MCRSPHEFPNPYGLVNPLLVDPTDHVKYYVKYHVGLGLCTDLPVDSLIREKHVNYHVELGLCADLPMNSLIHTD